MVGLQNYHNGSGIADVNGVKFKNWDKTGLIVG